MQDLPNPSAGASVPFYKNKIFLISAGLVSFGIAAALLDVTVNKGKIIGKMSQPFLSNSLGELDTLENIKKIQLIPIMTADEMAQEFPNKTADNQKILEKYKADGCFPDKISRFDLRLRVSAKAKTSYVMPTDLSTRPTYEQLLPKCKAYTVLAFVRRPFLFSATVNNGEGLVQWAQKNAQATQLWEAELIKYFLADWTGFASLSQGALGLDRVAGALVENFISNLFLASPRFHLQHELGRKGWVMSIAKDRSSPVLKSLLLFARQSMQTIYELPQGGKVYEWMVLNNRIFVTQSDGELLVATGLGSLISYMSVDAKLWESKQAGDAVLTLRMDSLFDSLVPLLQLKTQNSLSQLDASFALKASEQGLQLSGGTTAPSKISGLLSETLNPELFDAIPQEFAAAIGLAWEMPSLQVLSDKGPEGFLQKSSDDKASFMMIWDIDPKQNSQVALVGMGASDQPNQALSDQADHRNCESASGKKIWILASHPDLGARIQANCRNHKASPLRKVVEQQKIEQKAPQALLAINLGEAINSLYMLGGGHPDASEAEPKSSKDAGRLAAKAEAMKQVKELTSRLPVIGYAGRSLGDGSIQWQGF